MTFPEVIAIAAAVTGGMLAIAVAVRALRSPPRAAFAFGMALFVVEGLCGLLAARSTNAADIVQWQRWRMAAMSLLPATWLLFSLTYSRGNARDFFRRWRWTLLASLILPSALVLGFSSGLIDFAHPTPESVQWILRLGWRGLGLHLILIASAVLILTNLERTFRASVGTQRWRIKYLLLGVAVIFGSRIYTTSQALLFRGLDPAWVTIDAAALLIGSILITRSLFRTGSFNLDVYPSHSVLQNSATILLAGIYLLLVGVLAKVVTLLGGDAGFTVKAFVILVALVGLAVLLQSDRFRLHVRRLVSRHFQRPLYDYRTAWYKFTAGTAAHLDRGELCTTLARLVGETFQALSVSVWLVDDRAGTLGCAASTAAPTPVAGLGEAGPGSPTPATVRSVQNGGEAAEVIRHFQSRREPEDFESSPDAWAEALRSCHPSHFPNGGHRVCLPLHGRGDQFLGLILIGDRVAGAPFTIQDFDMLKGVADHATASLLNVQLSQRLLQARELEAFQTMAAFFVHDLKNAASTLNLLLANLPEHFDDPEFRADALRGMGRTVSHINEVVARLGLLRHELTLKTVPLNLNAVIEDVVSTWKNTGGELIKNLGPLPPVPLDAEQFGKVITNLVLNAFEAGGPKGRVTISTHEQRGRAVLTVADEGCGMSPEFVKQSLFRPFQTTKKSGLGIGMFQSKMIVEAHGGHITVESTPGVGTIFSVHLPVAAGERAEVAMPAMEKSVSGGE